jgi:hypothetical protein
MTHNSASKESLHTLARRAYDEHAASLEAASVNFPVPARSDAKILEAGLHRATRVSTIPLSKPLSAEGRRMIGRVFGDAYEMYDDRLSYRTGTPANADRDRHATVAWGALIGKVASEPAASEVSKPTFAPLQKTNVSPRLEPTTWSEPTPTKAKTEAAPSITMPDILRVVASGTMKELDDAALLVTDAFDAVSDAIRTMSSVDPDEGEAVVRRIGATRNVLDTFWRACGKRFQGVELLAAPGARAALASQALLRRQLNEIRSGLERATGIELPTASALEDDAYADEEEVFSEMWSVCSEWHDALNGKSKDEDVGSPEEVEARIDPSWIQQAEALGTPKEFERWVRGLRDRNGRPLAAPVVSAMVRVAKAAWDYDTDWKYAPVGARGDGSFVRWVRFFFLCIVILVSFAVIGMGSYILATDAANTLPAIPQAQPVVATVAATSATIASAWALAKGTMPFQRAEVTPVANAMLMSVHAHAESMTLGRFKEAARDANAVDWETQQIDVDRMGADLDVRAAKLGMVAPTGRGGVARKAAAARWYAQKEASLREGRKALEKQQAREKKAHEAKEEHDRRAARADDDVQRARTPAALAKFERDLAQWNARNGALEGFEEAVRFAAALPARGRPSVDAAGNVVVRLGLPMWAATAPAGTVTLESAMAEVREYLGDPQASSWFDFGASAKSTYTESDLRRVAETLVRMNKGAFDADARQQAEDLTRFHRGTAAVAGTFESVNAAAAHMQQAVDEACAGRPNATATTAAMARDVEAIAEADAVRFFQDMVDHISPLEQSVDPDGIQLGQLPACRAQTFNQDMSLQEQEAELDEHDASRWERVVAKLRAGMRRMGPFRPFSLGSDVMRQMFARWQGKAAHSILNVKGALADLHEAIFRLSIFKWTIRMLRDVVRYANIYYLLRGVGARRGDRTPTDRERVDTADVQNARHESSSSDEDEDSLDRAMRDAVREDEADDRAVRGGIEGVPADRQQRFLPSSRAKDVARQIVEMPALRCRAGVLARAGDGSAVPTHPLRRTAPANAQEDDDDVAHQGRLPDLERRSPGWVTVIDKVRIVADAAAFLYVAAPIAADLVLSAWALVPAMPDSILGCVKLLGMLGIVAVSTSIVSKVVKLVSSLTVGTNLEGSTATLMTKVVPTLYNVALVLSGAYLNNYWSVLMMAVGVYGVARGIRSSSSLARGGEGLVDRAAAGGGIFDKLIARGEAVLHVQVCKWITGRTFDELVEDARVGVCRSDKELFALCAAMFLIDSAIPAMMSQFGVATVVGDLFRRKPESSGLGANDDASGRGVVGKASAYLQQMLYGPKDIRNPNYTPTAMSDIESEAILASDAQLTSCARITQEMTVKLARRLRKSEPALREIVMDVMSTMEHTEAATARFACNMVELLTARPNAMQAAVVRVTQNYTVLGKLVENATKA